MLPVVVALAAGDVVTLVLVLAVAVADAVEDFVADAVDETDAVVVAETIAVVEIVASAAFSSPCRVPAQ